MRVDVQQTAELRKLAHALDVPPDRLAMLADVPAEDLRTLREQAGEALFQADRHYFTRIAALSKAVPTAVAAKLTEVALPPLLAARTAELLDPSRAAELVTRISPRYLADVSTHLDPARAADVIAAIPADRVAAVGRELARRAEWIVIGGFVAHVASPALAASVREFSGEQLLRVGFVLDDLSRLDDIGGILSDEQLDDLLAAAAASSLWPELESLLDNLSDERVTRLAARYAAAPKSVRSAFAAAAASGALSRLALDRLTPR
jgi:hypothetical protein